MPLPQHLTDAGENEPITLNVQPPGSTPAAPSPVLDGTVPNFPSSKKTLVAKCQKNGHNDSAVVQWNL